MSAGQLLKQANQLKRAGKLDEAIALYHLVIKTNLNFAWVPVVLGSKESRKNTFPHLGDSSLATKAGTDKLSLRDSLSLVEAKVRLADSLLFASDFLFSILTKVFLDISLKFILFA